MQQSVVFLKGSLCSRRPQRPRGFLCFLDVHPCVPASPRGFLCFLDVHPCVPASWFGGDGWAGGEGGLGGGHDKHTRSTLAPGPWVIILFSLFLLRTFCCCVSRVHPAPLLTRGSRHFGRVIRSCWTLTLKFSLVVRLILSRILRHLLVRYLLEALCPGVSYLLHCRVFALPGSRSRAPAPRLPRLCALPVLFYPDVCWSSTSLLHHPQASVASLPCLPTKTISHLAILDPLSTT